MEELYRIGKLTKDDLIEELEWLCRYYENLYDEIEHSASRSYVNEVADQIEKYRSWIKAVDNIEEEKALKATGMDTDALFRDGKAKDVALVDTAI